ncbi:hypothetical protein [Vibrio barjaei]|uniref:hypothetical protein n=1 Tax=Vibrio barjaei TaxID=1676683 RepID=UPI00228395FF|nr:hypothetical protein [Vibrio barjaei]MCY9872963.1 hypothetical protein [Vibrio barjaei]
MGMFDEIRAINISHPNFDKQHNDLSLQTKDLDCDMSGYCIFNHQLYKERDSSEEQSKTETFEKLDLTIEINGYLYVKRDNLELWIEYDFKFVDGTLVDVYAYEPQVTNDYRDHSIYRPSKPNNRIEVSLSVNGCTREKQNEFMSRITDEKLEAIRNILEEPTATIYYPAERTIDGIGLTTYPRLRTVASFVQTMEDIEMVNNHKAKVTAPSGDKLNLIMDEGYLFPKVALVNKDE